MDGDLQHPPETLPLLIRAVEDEGVDMAVASRNMKGGGVTWTSPVRRAISWTATLMATWLLPGILPTVRDPMSGYFAFKRSVIQGCTLRPEGYKILLEVLTRGRYRSVKEIPYYFVERRWGGSKLGRHQYVQFFIQLFRLSRETGELGRLVKYCATVSVGIFVGAGMLINLTAFGMGYFTSNAVSMTAAILTAVFLGEFWTFSDFSKRTSSVAARSSRFVYFSVFSVAALLTHLAFYWAVTVFVNLHYAVGIFVGTIPAAILSYGVNANIVWDSARAERKT